MKRLIVLAAIILLSLPVLVQSHPGRTDKDGCHMVHKRWVSKDGLRVYEAGTRHCHRVSDAVVLGQDDIRVAEDDDQDEDHDKDTHSQ